MDDNTPDLFTEAPAPGDSLTLGNYAERARIWTAHENYTRGFFRFLATDPRVPAAIRAQVQSWGLCKDEFKDTGGWPNQLYIREARRMIGAYVMTENELMKRRPTPESVGMGSYGIDSFSAIINPPQALIISVGAIVKKPVVGANDAIVAGQRMAIGLSADHRVVDGAIGAQYLAELRKLIESPALMLF